MILFLVLIYVAILFLAVKMGWIQMTLFWKLSPALWAIFLLIALIIPLQFWAPSGNVVTANYIVGIVPRVSGEVIDVPVKANTPIKKGEVLFKIDPVLFQAAVDSSTASLELARIRLEQQQSLMEKKLGREIDLERAKAEFDKATAALQRAQYELDATVVVAPLDGYVTAITLRPGARAVTLPLQPAMTFVESGNSWTGAYIMQNHLRYVESGQPAEIAFKMYPGRVFPATVDYVVSARATGMETTGGMPVGAQSVQHLPFAVRLKLGEEAAALNLPSGASGAVNIYSDIGSSVQVIRKVELRMTAIMNYINPF